MKLFYSAASPFVRKVMVSAAELRLDFERLPSAANPVTRDQTIVAKNPLGQVPTLITDDGAVLYDSRVICEYLNDLAAGSLFPASGPARWQARTEQALGDGILAAGVLVRYETVLRPKEKYWPDWRDGQMDKIRCGLDQIAGWAPGFRDRVDIGTITIGCLLGWLDFRYADLEWRQGRDPLAAWYATFSKRPSMTATEPHA